MTNEGRRHRYLTDKEFREKEKKRAREYGRRDYLAHRTERLARAKINRLRAKYGMELADVEQLYAQQEEGCAICGKKLPYQGKLGLHMDHDHRTGRRRGMLCPRCNVVVVAVIESDLYPKVLSYLAKYDS